MSDHLDRILQQLLGRADPTQPPARQLEQVAGAAIGYGLQWACERETWTTTPGLRGQIELAVDRFIAPANQVALHRAAAQAGVPPLDALAGIVLHHCQQDLAPLTPEQVARYGVEFGMAVAHVRPALAEQWRRWMSRGAA